MPASSKTVRVEGLRELDRAFRLYGNGLEKGVREALEAAGEPVRSEAQALAVSQIPRIGLTWSRMRVGVTRRTAYVAPTARGRRSGRKSRPNLAPLLLGRAMEPALDHNIANVERELGDALDDLGRMWARV